MGMFRKRFGVMGMFVGMIMVCVRGAGTIGVAEEGTYAVGPGEAFCAETITNFFDDNRGHFKAGKHS